MKKVTQFFAAALMALAVVVPAQANDLTLFDYTDQSNNVPIRGYYYDTEGYRVQVIYPSSELGMMEGSYISSMKFYIADSDGNQMSGGKLAVSIGTTEMNSFYESFIDEGFTQVAEITMTPGETEIVIDFTEPWMYSGGNLVIETNVTEGSNCPDVYFWGKEATVNNAIYGKAYTSTEGFYPKTTFTYEASPYNAKVNKQSLDFETVNVGEEAVQTVTLINLGANALTPNFGTVSAPFSVDAQPVELAYGESMEIPVKFAPTAVGNFASTFTIDCGLAGNFEISLTGIGVEVLNELVVADGTITNSYIPVYGYSYDAAGGIGQMIYPAEMLSDLVGKKINYVKFHRVPGRDKMDNGSILLSMKVVEEAAFADAVAISGLEAVSMGAPVKGEPEIVFNFGEPYEYNGGNLVLEAKVTQAGEFGMDYFYGINRESASYGYYNDFGFETRVFNFLPKASFGYLKAVYEIGDVNHDGKLTISDVTTLIDYLLAAASAAPEEADVNGDTNVNISDVTALIDMLLSGN